MSTLKELDSHDGKMRSCEVSDDISESKSSPDGGYGWVIVLAGFILNVVAIGFSYGFGVALVPMMEYFESGKMETSWVGSIQVFLIDFSGLLAAPMILHLGWRRTAVFGSVLAAVGYASSALVSDLRLLFFTYGVLSGLGFGLMYVISIVTIPFYFTKRRALATGLVISGSGIGQLFVGSVIQQAFKYLKWQWTLVLQAGIILLTVLCDFLIKPPSEYHSDENTPVAFPGEDTRLVPVPHKETKSTAHRFFGTLCDAEIFSNGRFLLISLAGNLFVFCYHANITYLPARAESYNVEPEKAALLVAMSGVCNVIGRLLFGFLAYSKTTRIIMAGSSLLVGGVLSMSSCLWISYPLMMTYSCLFGCTVGTFLAMIPLIIVDFVGLELSEKAFCVSIIISSFGLLCASPLSGWIIETYSNYELAFLVVGILQTIGSALCFITIYSPEQKRIHTKL